MIPGYKKFGVPFITIINSVRGTLPEWHTRPRKALRTTSGKLNNELVAFDTHRIKLGSRTDNGCWSSVGAWDRTDE